MAFKTVITLAFLGLLLGGCSETREYELRGQVLAVNPERLEVIVKHDDIPGFMPGMTMPFKVSDRTHLEGRTPGELIVATLVVGTNTVHLANIRRTGQTPIVDSVSPTAGRVNLLAAGAVVPDEIFVDHNGTPRRLSEWRPRVLAVTFTYTRCPLPDFCPLMDRHFVTVQQRVAAEPTLRDRVHLLSVSFDPAFDTPEVLRSHAERIGADTSFWNFVTGDAEDIDRFGSLFGVSVIREEQPAQQIVHNLRTAVIDGEGRLVRVLNGNEWTPEDLLAELRNAIDRW
jgi:protein SCO1/2